MKSYTAEKEFGSTGQK